MSDNPPDELPPPTRAGDDPGSNTGADAGSDATGATLPAGRPGPKRNRRFLILGGLAVVVVIAVAIVIFIATKGDGTKATANPLEVRQLVATFNCTSNNPGAPSDVKVTAGQEVVRVGRGGCAVVGPVIAKVDRATKVESKNTDGGCTMTFTSTSKYGEIVDKASVVTNGYARALVGGGYVLELRARLYPPAKPTKLTVTFESNQSGACTNVANALRRV